MSPLQMIRDVEVELVDVEALVNLLKALDVCAQTNSYLIPAYPLIHELLASKVATAFEAINPAILRS